MEIGIGKAKGKGKGKGKGIGIGIAIEMEAQVEVEVRVAIASANPGAQRWRRAAGECGRLHTLFPRRAKSPSAALSVTLAPGSLCPAADAARA